MKISNSQIMDFQKCEKRFYWSTVLGLRPLEMPEAMQRGLDGHELLELAFKGKQQGLDLDECLASLNPLIEQMYTNNAPGVSVYRHVLAMVTYAYNQEWEVVSVESNRLTPVAEVITADNEVALFAYTPDIVFRWTTGPRRGTCFMLDWKFTAYMWGDAQVHMFQQLPKYMIHWNMEHPEDRVMQLGIVNLLTRAPSSAPAEKLFKILWLTVPKQKLETIRRENARLMERVKTARETYEPEDYLRTVDNHQCRMCIFANDLCPADLEGRNTEKYIKLNYTHNTYFEDNYGPQSS